jgi:citrate synthase
LKEEILQVINENFIEMLLVVVNQNIQETLKKFQDNTNKEYEKTQKQINEIIGALNKDHHKQRDKWIKDKNWQY